MKAPTTLTWAAASCLAIVGLYSCIAQRPTQRIEFTAPDSYPEGIAFDSARQAYFVSSARTGTIGTVSGTGAYAIVHQTPT